MRSAKICIVVRGNVQDRFSEYYHPFGDAARAYTDDDAILAEALSSAGHHVTSAGWSDETVRWDSFDLILIRSPWGFFFDLNKWHRWLDHLESINANVQNSTALLRNYTSKDYLLELEAAGVTIVPTVVIEQGARFSLTQCVSNSGWNEFVIKPASLGGALDVARALAVEADSLQNAAEAISKNDQLIVQEYFPEISNGEWSFVFFGDSFSHAVRKTPKPGEWREQASYGGAPIACIPDKKLIEQAHQARLVFASRALYSRVDAMERNGRLYVNELELIDPRLFFTQDAHAASRMLTEVQRRL